MFTLIELRKSIVINFIFGGITFGLISGCSSPPYFPRTEYGTPEEVVIQAVEPNTVKIGKGQVFNKEDRIAVFNFKSPDLTQGGILVSDMFSSLLQAQGFTVVERDNIDQILNEQNLIDDEKILLTDLEIADRLGKLAAADYMIFGAVTLYQAEPQTIYLPIRIRDDDRDEYQKDYNTYKDKYLKSWDFWVPQNKKIQRLRAEDKVLSLTEIETELEKLSKQEFRVIASVGISAKVVDVKEGKVVWLGQGETADFTTVNATRRILEEFIKSMEK